MGKLILPDNLIRPNATFGQVAPLASISYDKQYPTDKILAWEQRISMRAAKLGGILTRSLPDQTSVKFKLIGEDRFFVQIRNTKEDFRDDRVFDMATKTIKAGSMRVSKQGQGTGSILFRNHVEAGVAIGFERFKVEASSDNGAYTWGITGVPLSDDETERKRIRQEMGFRIGIISPSIPDEVYQELVRLNSSDSKYAINEMARLDYDLNSLFSLENLEPNSGLLWKSFQQAFIARHQTQIFNGFSHEQKVMSANAILKKQMEKYHAALEHCQSKSKPFTLGHYLFVGQSYDGCLRFDDRVAMQAVSKRVGGFCFEQKSSSHQNLRQEPVVN